MPIQLYNTLTRQKEPFDPITPPKVGFYVCGVTVYDDCHIGHARAYVAFDCIRRYLIHRNYAVNYVQNFTDIDDKIINRAKRANIDIQTLTETTIKSYFEDMAALNIMPADHYPKATTHIDDMIQMIQTLIDNGHAYPADGDVLFSVESFRNYGTLSRRVLEDQNAGNRIAVSDNKRHALDFVLWKAAKEGEPAWDSPWGPGRPGWHIECSAMSIKELGPQIDIHGGGEDLIFPHHENEIAQSECTTKQQFVKYWLHNGFVTIDEEKMSKSKGNFVTVKDILKDHDGEALRFFLMRVHYRHPLNFSDTSLSEAEKGLHKLKNTLQNFPPDADPKSAEAQATTDALVEKFYAAMDDDFNYAEALGILFELSKHINTTGSGASALLELGQILGLFWEKDTDQGIPSEIQILIDQRQAARKDRDFSKADAIRDQLLNDFGVVLEDTPEGIRVKRV